MIQLGINLFIMLRVQSHIYQTDLKMDEHKQFRLYILKSFMETKFYHRQKKCMLMLSLYNHSNVNNLCFPNDLNSFYNY